MHAWLGCMSSPWFVCWLNIFSSSWNSFNLVDGLWISVTAAAIIIQSHERAHSVWEVSAPSFSCHSSHWGGAGEALNWEGLVFHSVWVCCVFVMPNWSDDLVSNSSPESEPFLFTPLLCPSTTTLSPVNLNGTNPPLLFSPTVKLQPHLSSSVFVSTFAHATNSCTAVHLYNKPDTPTAVTKGFTASNYLKNNFSANFSWWKLLKDIFNVVRKSHVSSANLRRVMKAHCWMNNIVTNTSGRCKCYNL